jgi:HD domain protein
MGYEYSVELLVHGARESSLFDAVSCAALELGQEVYVVGGYVRDSVLGRANTDVDFVTVGSGVELARRVTRALRGTRLQVFKNFGTASFHYKGLEVEFVGARRESYRRESRKPLVEDGTLEEDLARRDFTVNALAVSLNAADYGRLIDLYDGLGDMERAILRTPRPALETFDDDPLRMMRAARFASQLGFSIDDEAFAAMRARAERIQIVSPERIVDEFNKILLTPMPSIGLHVLNEARLLGQFLPEVVALQGVETVEGRGHKDNFYHTLQVVDNAASGGGDLWLRWAALLHDVGKAKTKRYVPKQGWTFHSHEFVGAKMVETIFRRLHMPLNEKMHRVEKLVSLHMRPIALVDDEVTDSAVRRLLFDGGEEIEQLMQLCEADITSKNARTVARYMSNFERVREKMRALEARDAVRNFQPPVRGEEIMELYGLAPGRVVGDLKSAIKDAILDGLIRNDREEALAFLNRKAKELGVCGD